MKKIFKLVCKCSIIAACICLALFAGYTFLVNSGRKITIPAPLGVVLVVITFFAVACLFAAALLEIYGRIQKKKKRAILFLVLEFVIICGICLFLTKRLGSLIMAAGVVIGSWGMNYIYRKEDAV